MRVSISKIKLFKACRRAYYFKYVEKLEPVQKAEALQVGLNYHELVEELYKGNAPDTEDYSKERAMAIAYYKYIFPKFHVKGVEEWVEYEVAPNRTLVGRVDGYTDDGYLVEHKTTSSEISEEYEFNLQWDEQIMAYMLATGMRKMYYTVCRKPTIRQKQNETEEEFFQRMIDWYDEDTEKKIRLLEITRTDEEIADFKKALEEIMDTIYFSEKSHNYYPNCMWCNVWGRRCEYSSICLNYNPTQNYIDFKRGD